MRYMGPYVVIRLQREEERKGERKREKESESKVCAHLCAGVCMWQRRSTISSEEGPD